MKSDFLAYAAIVVLVGALIFGVMYVARLFSNATTPITVHEVEPGVRCAAMVTADGAAIDCWKSEENNE